MTFNASRRDALRMLAAASLTGMTPSQRFSSTGTELRSSSISSNVVKDVRELIVRALARGESTGLAVAVVCQGRIVWEEGFGWSDRDARLKIDSHSAFNLESVTKPFTTSLITILAADGKLDLDQPANQYLGISKIKGSNGDPKKATVRKLGAHCSGLPGTFEPLYDAVRSPSTDEFLGNFGRLAFPPGEVWEYSNVAFQALGGIAENLTGTKFGSLMESRLLAPLGLKDSFWATDATRVSRSVPRYSQSGKKLPAHLYTTPASGELLSSVHDLARFAMWNMKLPLDSDSGLLNDHWINILHKPVFTGVGGAASTFGWALNKLSSGEIVIHKGGDGPGASTLVCFLPEQRLACVVLNNHRTQGLTNQICDTIMRGYFPAWRTLSENGEPPRTPFVINDNLAGIWKGTLVNDGVVIQVTLDVTSNTAATLVVGSGSALPLVELQSEGNAFLATGTGTIQSQHHLADTSRTLRLKLVPLNGSLIGRIDAIDPTPDHSEDIPYVLALEKVRQMAA